MSTQITIVSSILGVAIVLFASGWLRADLVAILVTVSLAASGVLSTEEAFSGFSSSAVIAIAGLLVIGKAMVRSGVVRWMAEQLYSLVGSSRFRLALVGTGVPGILSGFINIIAAVTIFIPALQRLSRKTGVPVSRLLLPMAAASLAGANLTLIGASHNLVVNDLLSTSGAERFGFFEFSLLGSAVFLAVVAYCLVPGKWLLPAVREAESRSSDTEETDLLDTYEIETRIWEIWIRPGSAAVGKSVGELGVGREFGLGPMMVIRRNKQLSVESADFRLEGKDILAVTGHRDRIEALAAARDGVTILGRPDPQNGFSWSMFALAEIVVPPRSAVVGRTLREMRLRKKTRLIAIALWRDGKPVRTNVREEPLRPGDAILLFGMREAVRGFDPAPDFLWLNGDDRETPPPNVRKLGPFAFGVLLLVILVSALGWIHVAVAAMVGAAAVVAAGVLSPQGAYQAIDWKTIIVIAGMFPVGRALDKSGAASEIANLLTDVLDGFGPLAVMAGIAGGAMLLTQVLHNAVVAVIMTPVAVQAAAAMGIDHKAFAVAVIVGASASFLLPVGHPAVMLVQRPGGYGNIDYLRFGAGLMVVVLVVLLTVAPFMWPFE